MVAKTQLQPVAQRAEVQLAQPGKAPVQSQVGMVATAGIQGQVTAQPGKAPVQAQVGNVETAGPQGQLSAQPVNIQQATAQQAAPKQTAAQANANNVIATAKTVTPAAASIVAQTLSSVGQLGGKLLQLASSVLTQVMSNSPGITAQISQNISQAALNGPKSLQTVLTLMNGKSAEVTGLLNTALGFVKGSGPVQAKLYSHLDSQLVKRDIPPEQLAALLSQVVDELSQEELKRKKRKDEQINEKAQALNSAEGMYNIFKQQDDEGWTTAAFMRVIHKERELQKELA